MDGAVVPETDLQCNVLKGEFVQHSCTQPPTFAATLINDRFSCGDAAIASYVPSPKARFCKGRNLRISAARTSRSIVNTGLFPTSNAAQDPVI